ncbi:PEP-CTERM sorting domain-containing protein [Coleofasciculus sp. FACHB-1120]|uniref:PEP-CTERM sorting domain-containing protein n=1 Tax=Coleofasciculus sp. FACHB-1120 TaxID=2692783 RepID=UPI00168A2256|nr:PEP-CTERM sorting domain-containing protein [Coleofasciculus sp. FACHB-1120]MBD2741749.1 PEP-CTERM sorting domain-containing protein [Coleofasciculus sp. FACHB-1120]
MKTRLRSLSVRDLSTVAGVALTAVVLSFPSPVQAIALVTERTALGGNDQIDWSSLGPTNPFNFLPNSFATTSEEGLGLFVDIPSAGANFTPPFVFQTLPPPNGIPTNFASGDFLLFTGFIPGSFPAVGNPGPLSISFDTPVFGAGAQIAVDDTPQFTGFISAFDETDTLLGALSAAGTSSLALDNSALFLGIKSDRANISRLVFSISEPNRALAINTLSIVAPTSVPEPTSVLGLFAFGTLSALSVLKRQQHKSIESNHV